MYRQLLGGTLVGLMAFCASATTTSYVWDDTATAFGDVAVTRNAEGQVTALQASIPTGDCVVFTGGEAKFAANAQIGTGYGDLIFSNAVTTAGALTLQGASLRHVWAGGREAGVAATNLITELKGVPAENVSFVSGIIAYDNYNGSGDIVKLTESKFFHSRMEGDIRTVQLQDYNGAWTRCAKMAMLATSEGLVVSNMYLAETRLYGVNYLGYDFDDMPTESKTTHETSLYVMDVGVLLNQSVESQRVVLAGPFSSGGSVTVSDGASCVATGTALGAVDGATCTQDIVFSNGYFTFQDCGRFTYAGAVSGATGTLAFVSSDLPAESSEVYTNLVLSSTAQTVLSNISLASVTGVTAGVSWRRYNNQSVVEPMHDPYVGDGLRAAFFRTIGQKTVARFQARAKTPGLQVNYSTGVLFEQAGNDISAKLVSVYDVWPLSTPEYDPWQWDAWNSNTGRVLPLSYTEVSNLTFKLAAPVNAVNRETDVSLAGSDATKQVDYVFRPGNNRRMTATVTSVNGISQVQGTVHVYDRATLALVCPDVSTDYTPTYQGLWTGQSSPSALYIHEGGRIYVGHTRINHGSQQIILDGGKMAFHDPSSDGGSSDSYRFRRGSFMANCVGNMTYRNGALTDGYTIYFGPMGCNRTLKVEGSTPSCAKNGFYVYGEKSEASPAKMTFDVEDVTGDARVDFTQAGNVKYANYVNACVIKKGEGTLRLDATLNHPVHPIRLQAGTVEMGLTNCLTLVKGASFEGGTLASATNLVYAIGGPVTMVADSGLAPVDGSTIKFADSSATTWTDGATLSITADPVLAAVYVGTNEVSLTAQQLRRVRWNGERCRLLADGRLWMSPVGFRLILR